MIESDALKNWLYAKLNGNATVAAGVATRIYQSVAPEKAVYPFVVFDFLIGLDVPGICDARVKTEFQVQVKLLHNKTPGATERTLLETIDSLFQNTTNDISNGYVFTSRRLSAVDYKEPKPNSAEIFYHIGGVYFVQVSKA